MKVFLNCDLGEGEEPELTVALLDLVDFANIACGGHAGDEPTMRRVVRAAADRKVGTGAHPGWPDREHFGRRANGVTPAALVRLMKEQIRELQRVIAEEGATLSHVKLHGALYHLCDEHPELAEACVDLMEDEWEGCPLVVGAGGLLHAVAEARGVPLMREIFAERGYSGEARLVPRGEPGDLLSDPEQVAERLEAWRRTGYLPVAGSHPWLVEAETVCVHSDSPGSLAIARRVREVLG